MTSLPTLALRLTAALAVSLAAAFPANALCVCLVCITGAYVHYTNFASSMEPTLPVDSCILTRTVRAGDRPTPGEIVVFVHPVTDDAIVKRVVAMPGQTVEMVAGRLLLDGVPVRQERIEDYARPLTPNSQGIIPFCPEPTPVGGTCAIPRFIETLPNGAQYEVLDQTQDSTADDMPPVTVPDDHVFVLGDDRDNSHDSRFARDVMGPGPVPIAAILGTYVRQLDVIP